ncbi:hypothetical protein DZA53_12745 [Xanthomonas oryzae pv. oryzae]|nr:hypothetical protein DZA53_12745 [Xanthomonas oryzae pv. oryzae]
MDAATVLTRTYLQRVPRWWAGKDPAAKPQISCFPPDRPASCWTGWLNRRAPCRQHLADNCPTLEEAPGALAPRETAAAQCLAAQHTNRCLLPAAEAQPPPCPRRRDTGSISARRLHWCECLPG